MPWPPKHDDLRRPTVHVMEQKRPGAMQSSQLAGEGRVWPEEYPRMVRMAVAPDRVLMVFKGLTMQDAMRAAEQAHISNPAAWSRSAWLCGEWTLAYEVRNE